MYTPTTTCIPVTRRCFITTGTIKIVFTPSKLQDSVLMEGRATRNAWEQEDARGRIQLNMAGTVTSHYGGTMTMRNMQTNQVVSQYEAGKTYKIEITGAVANTYINYLGNSHNMAAPFSGKIHALRVDGCTIGYTSPVANQGVASDLHIQFDAWDQTTSPPAESWPNANLKRVTETVMTGAVANVAGGWTYDAGTNTWTSTRTNWNRLYAFKSATAVDGRRPYERLLRIVCNVELNGKVLRLYYESVGQGNCNVLLKEGYNEFIVYIKENSTTADLRPKFDSIDNQGVKIKNLRVYESIDCRIQGATWTEHSV